mgnify:CR=1 FL=1
MFLSDTHTHSRFSFDGSDTAAAIDADAGREDLARMALDLALRSYASQLACARILDILQPPCEEAPKKAKK